MLYRASNGWGKDIRFCDSVLLPCPTEDEPSWSGERSMWKRLTHQHGSNDISYRTRSTERTQVQQASNAISLTQTTSRKIASLLDAITKKQSPFYRRITGRVKPGSDVIGFQAYLASLCGQEALWSRVVELVSDSESPLFKPEIEQPEVFRAMGPCGPPFDIRAMAYRGL